MQDIPITITGGEIAWIVTLIISFSTLINIIISWVKSIKTKANEPNRLQDEKISTISLRLDGLRRDLDKCNDKIDSAMMHYDDLIKHYYNTRNRHDKEIESLSEGQVILAKAVKEITDHFLHESNEDGMKESVKELDNYIYTQMQKVNAHNRGDDFEYIKQNI